MNSLWTKTTTLPEFAPLHGDLKTDVLIIGGGLTGLLCAWKLKQAGVDYALVEAARLCGGATGKTTAKVTAQHGLIYHKLLKTLGEARTRMYFQANQRAVEEYRTLCKNIPCDFEERDSYIYSRNNPKLLEQELKALRRLSCEADLVQNLPLPFPTMGAVRLRGQAQFHPLKFAAGIAKGLRIFEHTKVQELGTHTAHTNHGVIHAKSIIVATHFPILNKHGGYFLKLYQERSYVLALENGPNLHGIYLDEAQDGLSFRNYGELLLLGGPSCRTGTCDGGWRELEELSRRYYPKARVAFRWANQDCMTLDGSAYIGPYAKRVQGLYTASGFNQWGMTSSMVAANILTDDVLGRKNPYAAAFFPARSVLHPQLAANTVEAVLSLLTPSAPRCPHMGCALKRNRQENSWDCPCHGSRFTHSGHLLDNPATDDLRNRADS